MSKPDVVAQWETFGEKLPTSDCADQYVRDNAMHIPFADILFSDIIGHNNQDGIAMQLVEPRSLMQVI